MFVLENYFVLGIILLLAGFLLPLIFLRSGLSRKLSILLVALGSCDLIYLSLAAGLSRQTLKVSAYSLNPFLELGFYVDRLSSFFILVISIVALCVSIYSWSYISHIEKPLKRNMIASLMSLFVLSMVLVVSSKNMISFLAFWEVMSVASFFLVMSEYEKPETKRAGQFYFIMTQLSTAFIIMFFVGMYLVAGTFEITGISVKSQIVSALLFLSFFIGFGIKAGMIPFHKWLPYAHSAAPSNISALMSGVMIKVAIYAMIRFLVYVFEPSLWWGVIILLIGTISALLGVMYALKEHDIKRLLAYHSIENIGIIMIGIGLYVTLSVAGAQKLAMLSLAAALFHTLNHAVFKALLFMAAGSVVNSTGTRNIEKMGGLVKVMPYTAALFLVGSIAISALPPLNGFVSELMIFEAFIRSAAAPLSPLIIIFLFICMSIFALTSALAAACFVKAFGITFLSAPRSEKARNAKESDIPMLVGPFFLAALCILLGVFSFQIFSWLGYDLAIPNLLPLSAALLTFAVLVIIGIRLFSNTRSRKSETWGCGIISQKSTMEYTASGFSQPIVRIFDSLYMAKEHNERKFYDNHNSIFSEGKAEIRIKRIFEEYLYDPTANLVRKMSSFAASLQSSIEPDSYILHMFVTNIILLIFAWWII